jgi:hypothetical protein
MTTTGGYVVLRWLEANNCVAHVKLRFSCTVRAMSVKGVWGGGRPLTTVCTNNRNVATALMVKQEHLLCLRLYGAFLEVFRDFIFPFFLVLAMCVGLCALRNVGMMHEWPGIHRIREIFLHMIPWLPCLPVCRRNILTAFYSLVVVVIMESVECAQRPKKLLSTNI